MNDLMSIREYLLEALPESAKEAAKDYAVSLVGESVHVAGAAFGGLCGALAGAAVKKLLHAILKHQNSLALKLDMIIAEPLKTGLFQAELGMMEVATPEDEELRQHYLLEAMDKLEEARTYAERQGAGNIVCQIRIMQGVCAYYRGSDTYTTVYFQKAIPYVESKIEELAVHKKADQERAFLYRASIVAVQNGEMPPKATLELLTKDEQIKAFDGEAKKSEAIVHALESQQRQLAELIGILKMVPLSKVAEVPEAGP